MIKTVIAQARVSLSGTIVTGFGILSANWTGPGLCELALVDRVGVNEWLVQITEWAESDVHVGVTPAANLDADEQTLKVSMKNGAGAPTSAAFSITVDRVVP